MNNENDILAELRDLNSPLAGISRTMPCHVPVNYFEKLPGDVFSGIKHIEEPETRPAWGDNPFTVPAGYFDQLTGILISAAKSEHISVNSREMPYHVPKNYFEKLPGQVMKAVMALTTTSKTIPLGHKNRFRRMQWAAAAIFIIFMGVGGYITFFGDHSYSEKILASVPRNEIHDYLQHTYRIDVDKIEGNNDINNLQVDNTEIVQYLNETGWDLIE